MNQEDSENLDHDSFFVDASATATTPTVSAEAPQSEPPVMPAQSSTSRRLVDFEGDDPVEFLETSGLKRDRVVPDIEKPWMVHHRFERATSVEQVNWIVDECIRAGRCSLDLETEGLDNRIRYREDGSPETYHRIVGFCISYDGLTGWYIPVRHQRAEDGSDLNVYPTEEVEAAISRLCHAAIPEGTPEAIKSDPLSYQCDAPKLVIFFWNAQFDHEFLYPITGIDWWHPASFEDGMLACFCIHAGDKKLGLKLKAKEFLKDADGNPYEMIELKELFFGRPKDIRFALLQPDEPGVLRYAGSDAVCTFMLCVMPEIVPTALEKHGYTYRIEKQTSNALRVMERSRVRINRKQVRHLLRAQQVQKDALLEKIHAFSKRVRNVVLDPNSPKQLSEFLFGPKPAGLDISPKPEILKASGQYKTDGDTLEELAKSPHAPGILKDIVRYREVDKLIGTYLTGLSNNPDENDEIRVSFKQTGAASGRLSAPANRPEHGYSGIPVHGIPGDSDLRRYFEAREGYTMVKADFAGEELRIAANVTGEKVWVDEFLNGTGDLHSITARAFFGKQDITKEERQAAKIVNFLLIYGGGPQAIMRATNCSAEEGKRRKDAFDKAVPTFVAWIKEQHKKVKRQKGVYTAFGRWLYLPDANDPDPKVRSAVERHAVNYQIQGCQQYDSFVHTSRGYQRIGELFERDEPITVWTGTRWAKAIVQDMGEHELAEIVLSDGTILKCDTRHELLVVTDAGYQWTHFSELKLGQRIAQGVAQTMEYEAPLPVPEVERSTIHNANRFTPVVSEDLWYWLGRYMGDGCLFPGLLSYAFGDHEQKDMAACAAFWQTQGLPSSSSCKTHTPCIKESTRWKLDINSVELCRWLVALGFSYGVDAHTKRVPPRVFGETLAYRKAFLRGMMESDGFMASSHHMLNIHLCQRELLEDFRLLFRSIGVDTRLRGPYTYTDKRCGRVTRSYRLDIPTRPYRNLMEGESTWKPKQGSLAPRFLINEFIANCRARQVNLKTLGSSGNVLYCRIANGGDTTVDTLMWMSKMLGVPLESPVYAHSKIVELRRKEQVKRTYTLSVADPMHRYEAEGSIAKNCGADIMKICLILLTKKFQGLGWLKNGGDDSVRMLLTVHDEVVFEVRNDRVAEAIPIIVDTMEYPWRIPVKPKWKVPLVVEPLLGFNWKSGYAAERAKVNRHIEKTEIDRVEDGIPLRKFEVLMNGFVYSTTREPKKHKETKEILETLDRDEVLEGKVFRIMDPPWLKGAKLPPPPETPPDTTPDTTPAADEPAGDGAPPSVGAAPECASPSDTEAETPVFCLRLQQMNRRTAAQVARIISDTLDHESGVYIHMIEVGGTTKTLVPPGRFRVNKERFIEMFRDKNLACTRDLNDAQKT